MTNTNYDFLGFMNYQSGTQETKVRPATPGQIKYYLDLCKQRNVEPKDVNNFTFDTMSEEIQRLMKFYPASPAQIKLITDKVNNLKSIISVINFTDEQVETFKNDESNIISTIIVGIIDNSLKLDSIISKLTGGKDGTASKLIENLINVEKKFSNIQEPTEKQLEIMVNMFLCPDVPFENYGISRRIELEDGLWRKPTPEEFANQIKSTLTKADASKFIDDYRGVFYEWKKTRIRPEQLRYIMELESRLGSQSPTTEINEAYTINGDVIEINKNKREYIKGTEYVPHTQEQLIQFSIEQASEFIDQLKSELNRREASSFAELETDELNASFYNKNEVDIEYEELKNLMYKLEAVAGYNDEDLHEAVGIELIKDDDPESNVKNRKKIREFMKDLLETSSITIEGLLELTKDCPTALRILVDM